jgi:hypothetical protein
MGSVAPNAVSKLPSGPTIILHSYTPRAPNPVERFARSPIGTRLDLRTAAVLVSCTSRANSPGTSAPCMRMLVSERRRHASDR